MGKGKKKWGEGGEGGSSFVYNCYILTYCIYNCIMWIIIMFAAIDFDKHIVF